jgi:hypothetical protein
VYIRERGGGSLLHLNSPFLPILSSQRWVVNLCTSISFINITFSFSSAQCYSTSLTLAIFAVSRDDILPGIRCCCTRSWNWR